MGRKTYQTVGKVFPGRKIFVLSRSIVTLPGAEVRSEIGDFVENRHSRYWVCGGSETYRLLLPRCRYLYLLRLFHNIPGDAFFPAFEQDFRLDGLIHLTEEFQIERWSHLEYQKFSMLPVEEWPFEDGAFLKNDPAQALPEFAPQSC